jgi:hypothetical protein
MKDICGRIEAGFRNAETAAKLIFDQFYHLLQSALQGFSLLVEVQLLG